MPTISEISKNAWQSLTRNIFLKVISFSGALMIWAWVQNEKVADQNARVNVRYILPKGLVPIQDLRQNITIVLQGAQGRLRAIDNSRIKVVRDLSEANTGDNLHVLSSDDVINLPVGVKVLRFLPPSLDIKMDKPMTKEVIIKPNIMGKPAEGWKINKINTDPKSIAITGAQTLVSSLKDVTTEAIKINNLRATKTFSTNVTLPFNSLKISDPKPIIVQVETKPLFSTRSFADIPVEIRKRNEWIVEPNVVDLTLEGPLADLESLQPEDLTVLLTLPELDTDQTQYNLRFEREKPNKNIHLVIQGNNQILRPIKIRPSNFLLQKAK